MRIIQCGKHFLLWRFKLSMEGKMIKYSTLSTCKQRTKENKREENKGETRLLTFDFMKFLISSEIWAAHRVDEEEQTPWHVWQNEVKGKGSALMKSSKQEKIRKNEGERETEDVSGRFRCENFHSFCEENQPPACECEIVRWWRNLSEILQVRERERYGEEDKERIKTRDNTWQSKRRMRGRRCSRYIGGQSEHQMYMK